MAEIRVERGRRSYTWIWIVAAVLILIGVVVLLDWAGYINLPVRLGTGAVPAPLQLAAGLAAFTREL